jgi:hypothetical protein
MYTHDIDVLIQMLNETCSEIRTGGSLCNVFPVNRGPKYGDVLLPLLFNLALEYNISNVQENQEGVELDGTCTLLIKTVNITKNMHRFY